MDRCSIDAHGTALTDETIAAAKSADAVLLGGPACGNGAVRPEPGLLKLRKGMDIYGKLWPCFFASGSLVDASLPEASVCCGTVLSSSLYTPALYTLASVNSGSDETQNLTPIPRLSVLTIWLGRAPGDTINDGPSITPSIGLLPSANLSHILDIKGVPKLFGTILSVAMILCYSLNLPVEAKAVEGVIRVALKGGLHAKDLGGNTTTEEVGDAVVQELEKIPKA
ncbi:3-isopropylmalate dehydrogenase [Fusarium proliferatum]|nr:3-isopropylmalate dehydrogenase [Fusarium proliferatum]KAG4267813.1 3-isopropylmalate dehydrogenase [Fusarium proliferatum]